MTTTRRAPQPQTDELSVATELAVMREILKRVEAKLTTIEGMVDGHATQIDRWRTAGKIIGPVLVALGAALGAVSENILMWLAKAVKA